MLLYALGSCQILPNPIKRFQILPKPLNPSKSFQILSNVVAPLFFCGCVGASFVDVVPSHALRARKPFACTSPHILSDGLMCFQMPSDAFRCIQILPAALIVHQSRALRRFQMPPHALICSQMLSYAVICSRMPPDAFRCSMLSYAFIHIICPQMLSDAFICSHMVPDATICLHMLPDAFIYSQML